MNKESLWICYYTEEGGERNAFLFVSKDGTDREAKQFINRNYGGNYDKSAGVEVYPVERESDSKGNDYLIRLVKE